MKRNLIIGIVLLVASLSAQAQFMKPLKSQRQESNLAFSDYTIGVKLGCPWSVMLDSELSKVTYKGNIGYSLGIVIERYFPKFSVGIEGLFAQKGTEMNYDMSYQQSLTTNGIYHREFYWGYNVVSIRIPLTYYFKGTFRDDKVIPYVFIAPQVDIPLSFNATLKQGKPVFEPKTEQTIVTTYSDFIDTLRINATPSMNISAIAGLGLMGRIPTDGSAIIIKFEVGANYGLRNLAEEGFIWKLDKDTKKLVPKENSRTICSHDLEAHLSVIFPIKKRLRDACYYFNKK